MLRSSVKSLPRESCAVCPVILIPPVTLEHPVRAGLWGVRLFSKPNPSLGGGQGRSSSAHSLHRFVKIQPLISTPVPGGGERAREELIRQHFCSAWGWPAAGQFTGSSQRSVSNREPLLQNHFRFSSFGKETACTRQGLPMAFTFQLRSVLVQLPKMKGEMFPQLGITYPFQRLQEVLSFFKLLNTDDNFVSCAFGNIL